MIALATVAGCAARKSPAPAPDVAELPQGSFSRTWTADLRLGKKEQASQLFVRENSVFMYSNRDIAYVLDRSGGQLQFINPIKVSGGILRPPIVLPAAIIYPSGSTIEVYNRRGRPVQTVELDKPTRSPAIGAGNMVYLGMDHTAGAGVIAAVDVARQYRWVRWELMTGKAVSAAPAIFEKVIYAGSEDGKLYAVDDQRSGVWPLPGGVFSTGGRFVSDVKADDLGVYASSTDTKLYCLDRLNGRMKWQYYSGQPLKTSPIVTATMIYQLVPGRGIVGIDKINGAYNRAPLWNVRDAVQVLSEDDKNVHLRRKDNRIMAVNKTSGQVAFTSRTKNYHIFATNLADPMIYAATQSGQIVAIKPVTTAGEVGAVVMEMREMDRLAMANDQTR